MSKGLFVMDDMPKNGCMDCRICRETLLKTICGITGNGVRGNRERGGSPEECPLRELPEKIDYRSGMSLSEMGKMRGWNACIDAITGGKKC